MKLTQTVQHKNIFLEMKPVKLLGAVFSIVFLCTRKKITVFLVQDENLTTNSNLNYRDTFLKMFMHYLLSYLESNV